MVDPRTSWIGRGSDDREDVAVVECSGKRCPRCGELKDADQFYPDGRTRTGLASWCKECSRQDKREHQRRKKGHPVTGRIAQPRLCQCCGYSFTPSDHRHKVARFCSATCNAASKGQSTPDGSCRLYWWRCRDCSVVFKLSGDRPPGGNCLCDVCRPLARQRTMRDINRRKNAKRRGAGAGDYTLKMLGDRDGWRCHLCGRKVREDLSGNDKWGPTPDHLVPVSAGGRDEFVNVALAHRHCNVARSNRGEVQLRLLA